MFAAEEDGSTEHLNVHIHQQEALPQGGHTFTIDVRSLPDTPGLPGTLLHHRNINTP